MPISFLIYPQVKCTTVFNCVIENALAEIFPSERFFIRMFGCYLL